ncbi:unnamed protein product [Trichogramma brassicae]|uniref:Uncharacterized protein n=1 Tax=Trichogramma brassicae TaxID=86971 RepID=A0A6H5I6X8_9HYME|nr:unnamed protein product [Trichogramma brassicae]
MDIGVTDDVLNGIPYEESSESDEEIEEEETEEVETETTIIKSKRGNRERPISFTKMDDIKKSWESTSREGRKESLREARKEEIAGIRSRLFMVRGVDSRHYIAVFCCCLSTILLLSEDGFVQR